MKLDIWLPFMTFCILKPIYGRWKRVSPWHDFYTHRKLYYLYFKETQYSTALKWFCSFSYWNDCIIICYTDR